MSSLINNLNEIYEIKQEIKGILNTEEDVFSYYPDLITAAISSGGATGTYNIVENGTWPVAAYAYAYVNVPMQEVPVVPDGYTYVYGGKEIITNGNNIDIASYSYVNVNVPAPEGWIYPSGYAYITTNGNFSIREFNYVNVAVPQGGLDWDDVASYGYIVPAGTKSITANGTGIDVSAYASVDVAVPQSSGTSYYVIDDLLDIFNQDLNAWTGPANGTDVELKGLQNPTFDAYPVSAVLSSIPQSLQDVLQSYTSSYLVTTKVLMNGSITSQPVYSIQSEIPTENGWVDIKGQVYHDDSMLSLPMVIAVTSSYILAGGVGGLEINANGNYDTSTYSYVAVSGVPSTYTIAGTFMQEQYNELGYFYALSFTGDRYVNYYVTGNYKFGYQYSITVKPYYDDNQTPMVYNVVNSEEVGFDSGMQTYTDTRYYQADSYANEAVSYGYGSNRYNTRYYFYAYAAETPSNPEIYILSEANSTIANLTGGEQLSITYIQNGTWKLVVSVEVVNS